jgi:pyruvate dehydrogenase E1 component alpha subunit
VSKKASVSEDAARANRERPSEPKPYKATKEELLKFYRDMLLIRRFEEKAGQLYGLGLIGGFCHLYIGQEAVAIGLQSALTPGKDSVITGYRDHGHMLAAGMDPREVMAELTGRSGGSSEAPPAPCPARGDRDPSCARPCPSGHQGDHRSQCQVRQG